jgi:hypothetical protein
MLSSSYTHSNSFSCHPSAASVGSEAASNKSVVSMGKQLARKASHLQLALSFLASDRKAGLSSQVHNNRNNKDASKAIHTNHSGFGEGNASVDTLFLLCWGESSTPNSYSDKMTNKIYFVRIIYCKLSTIIIYNNQNINPCYNCIQVIP